MPRGEDHAEAERVAGPAPPRHAGSDVFVYFDNSMKVRAPADPAGLAERFGIAGNQLPRAIWERTG